ncbi:hypothetical protein CPB84DRAFT_1009856 [Gymnopilus junonius]|uniref:Protein kinase domain-containing protein n=1 Tax=Gymnopilus junonius TaxID=109634 RepID=A0A9P5TM78_GYMJU|nr:hypothetical protein CPB84DRAFT_1009856 [Gymnopilus junonius]
MENRPNGPHLCVVYPLAGPSIVSMLDRPGSVLGSIHLRSDLARKVIKQVANAVELIHGTGFVHGDTEVYLHFGEPATEDVVNLDHTPLGPHVPPHVVASIDNAYLTNPTYLQEDTLLIDFGQSFEVSTSVSKDNYEPATVLHYQSPIRNFNRCCYLPRPHRSNTNWRVLEVKMNHH